MSKNKASFSRLLKYGKIDNFNFFIIEIEENGEKNLYASHYVYDDHVFEEFKFGMFGISEDELSKKCLMSTCKDAFSMFEDSHVTHFEADCSSLISSEYMFRDSAIVSVKGIFSNLENADLMFYRSKIKEIEVDFPKLKYAYGMFSLSSLKKFKGNLDSIEDSGAMFSGSNLEVFNCKSKKIKLDKSAFNDTSEYLKKNQPYLIV